MVVLIGAHGDSRCVLEGVELSTESSQNLKGGETTEMATHVVAQVSKLVPWSLGDLVLNNVDSSGHVVEVLTPGAKMSLGEYRYMRSEGDGSFALPTQKAGLELVVYGDGEPIPLDWSQAMEVGGGDGFQETNKEVELIMAFSQIVGVSCDGYIEKLREDFAHILASKVNKAAKKNVGGDQGGRKGLRELVNLISTVNYEGGGGSVTQSRGKERGNRIVS